MRLRTAVVCAAVGIAAAGCRPQEPVTTVGRPAAMAASAPPASFYASRFERHPDAATLTELGRVLFTDISLSSSGRMACSSCHDPAHAYGPPNALAVQMGGRDLKQSGVRAVPSLMYQQDTPPFTEHYSETDGNDSIDQGPTGGRGWDGRAQSAHEQAAVPLLSAFEMGNADSAEAVARMRLSPHADRLRAAFGPHVLDDPVLAWNALLLALEVFQQSPADFYPYTSKYDAFLRNKTALGESETRGLALFNDPAKGNCAQCHPSAIRRGAFPQFTDRGFIAIGVPRNPAIPANRDPAYRDLGLCGPLRTDLQDRPEYCGLFKTPSLRNVAMRHVFFHNGVVHRLGDAVRFYAQRDLHAERFEVRGGVAASKRHVEDLPARYRDNLNTEAPFDRKPGDRPALSDAEIRDVVAFLRTLNDGFVPR